MSTTFYGKGVALAGMKTACGAVLIATQHTDFVTPRSKNSGGDASVIKRASAAATASAPTIDADDLNFHVTDTAGKNLVDWPYRIETKSGVKIEGRTDSDGMTLAIASKLAEQATLFVYEPEAAPIKADWDR